MDDYNLIPWRALTVIGTIADTEVTYTAVGDERHRVLRRYLHSRRLPAGYRVLAGETPWPAHLVDWEGIWVPGVVETGRESLDSALAGGLPRGRVTTLERSGGLGLALEIVRHALDVQASVAWVSLKGVAPQACASSQVLVCEPATLESGLDAASEFARSTDLVVVQGLEAYVRDSLDTLLQGEDVAQSALHQRRLQTFLNQINTTPHASSAAAVVFVLAEKAPTALRLMSYVRLAVDRVVIKVLKSKVSAPFQEVRLGE